MACELSFVPKVEVCITNKCDAICIKETTDVVQLPYNSTGWGTSTLTTDLVVGAEVRFFAWDDLDTYLQNFVLKDNLVDLYPNTTPTPFVVTTDEAWEQADGIFKVEYSIADGSASYTNTSYYVLFICNIETCFDNLVTKIIQECDSIKLDNYKDILNQLEVIMYGIKSAFKCGEYATATTLIAAAKVICDNMCDCDCGDC